MALTAAHCVTKAWDSDNLPNNARVKLTGSTEGAADEWFDIQEIRVNDCWDFDDMRSTINNDLAIIILDREKPNAVEGVDYYTPWYGSQSDLVGQ
jgi:secreted trypsin-like serine protease